MEIDTKSELDSLLHDLNIYNRNTIKNLEDLTKNLGAKNLGKKLILSDKQADFVREKAQVLIDTAQQSNFRIRFYDMLMYLNDPKKLKSYKDSLGVKEIDLYGKFDKASLGKKSEIKKKNLKININQDYYNKQSITVFSLAELIPFVILDNAIKYSPRDRDIDIYFIENEGFIKVIIENEGPSVTPEELDKICEAGQRGINAESFEGLGMGLYFVDRVCKESDINFSIECNCERTYSFNGIEHTTFKVILEIPKKYEE